MNAEEITDFDGRFLYSGPHPQRHHRQPSTSGYSSTYIDRPHLDSCRHRQVTNSSRYIQAQMKNRMELMRLNDRRQTLDRQQRSATTVIDRNKRKFASEMANVAQTTSDLTDTFPTSGRRRQRAATAGTSSSRRNEKADGITPALAALQLHERDVEISRQRGFSLRPNTRPASDYINRMAGVGIRSEYVTASNAPYQRHRMVPDTRRSTTRSNSTVTARACQSAAGRTTVARQDIRIKRAPTFTGVSRANVILPDRALEILRASSATDSAAVDTEKQETPEAERSSEEVDGIAADHGRERASRWKKDLKREVPPALYGYRPTLNFHAVMSQAEKRRRAVALQTRQMAPLYSSDVNSKPTLKTEQWCANFQPRAT